MLAAKAMEEAGGEEGGGWSGERPGLATSLQRGPGGAGASETAACRTASPDESMILDEGAAPPDPGGAASWGGAPCGGPREGPIRTASPDESLVRRGGLRPLVTPGDRPAVSGPRCQVAGAARAPRWGHSTRLRWAQLPGGPREAVEGLGIEPVSSKGSQAPAVGGGPECEAGADVGDRDGVTAVVRARAAAAL